MGGRGTPEVVISTRPCQTSASGLEVTYTQGPIGGDLGNRRCKRDACSSAHRLCSTHSSSGWKNALRRATNCLRPIPVAVQSSVNPRHCCSFQNADAYIRACTVITLRLSVGMITTRVRVHSNHLFLVDHYARTVITLSIVTEE